MNYEASYDEETDGYTTITNYYPTVDTVNSIVSKVWDDNNNQDGKRPTSIQVQLNADGTPKRSPVTLDEANDWSYIFDNLPEINNGVEIVYTVKEVDIPSGYTVSCLLDASGFTIVKRYEAKMIEKTVMKVWSDTNDQDGLRTDEITVQLYENGDICGSAVVLNEANNWSYTWSSLDKYDAGTENEYTVKRLTCQLAIQPATARIPLS